MKLCLLLLTLTLPACASALDVARTTTIITGQATEIARDTLQTKRPELVAEYRSRAEAAHPGDRDAAADEFLRLGRPLEQASAAVQAALETWRAMAASLLAWEAGVGDQPSWQRVAFCAASSVLAILRGFEALGLEPPEVVARASRDLAPFAGQMCGLVPTGSATGPVGAAGTARRVTGKPGRHLGNAAAVATRPAVGARASTGSGTRAARVRRLPGPVVLVAPGGSS